MRIAIRYRRNDHHHNNYENGEFVINGFERLSFADRERALEHALQRAGADPADLTFLERQPAPGQRCHDLEMIYLRDDFPYHTLDSCVEAPPQRYYPTQSEYISSRDVALVSVYTAQRTPYGIAIAQLLSSQARQFTADMTYWRRDSPHAPTTVNGHPLFSGNHYQMVLPLTTVSGDYSASFTIRAGDYIVLGGEFSFHVSQAEELRVIHREEYTDRLNGTLIFHLQSSRDARATIHFVYQTTPDNSFSTTPRRIDIHEGEFRYVVPMNNRIPTGHAYAMIRFEDGTVVSVRC